MNLIRIWKNRNEILEGINNSIFKKEHIEQIAEERIKICEQCPSGFYGNDGCIVIGTHPCCNQKLGGCGCSLSLKTRSMSSSCPMNHWTSFGFSATFAA
jgi:hypothetical protein